MKNKKTTVLVLAVSAILLSGCSFGPAKSTSSNGTQKFTVSNSFWKSEDGGKTWAVKNQASKSPTTSDLDILSVEIDPFNGNDVLLGLRSGGMVRTQDGGNSLDFTTFKLDKVYGLAFNSADPKTIYASAISGGRGKIAKTTDGGNNWDDVYTFPADGPLVIAITEDKSAPGTLYASTSDNQVMKSSDGGTTWKNIYKSITPIIKIRVDSGNGQMVYLLTQGGGMLKSQNGGTSFESLDQNISNARFQTSGYDVLETDPTLSQTVYLAGKPGMILSRDGGKTWKSVAIINNPETSPVRALAINPQNSSELIYGAGEATYRSTDGGSTWTTFQFNTGKTINVIKYSIMNPNMVYLGFANK